MDTKILKAILPLGLGGLGFYVLYLLFDKFNFSFSTIGPELSAVVAIVFLVVVAWVVALSIKHGPGATKIANDSAKGHAILTSVEDELPSEFSQLTVEEIMARINSLPEFQKSKLESEFNGIWVKWTGILNDIETSWRDSSHHTVRLKADEHFHRIDFDVPINKYPELKTLNKGQAITVTGKIIGASPKGAFVRLKVYDIKFP